MSFVCREKRLGNAQESEKESTTTLPLLLRGRAEEGAREGAHSKYSFLRSLPHALASSVAENMRAAVGSRAQSCLFCGRRFTKGAVSSAEEQPGRDPSSRRRPSPCAPESPRAEGADSVPFLPRTDYYKARFSSPPAHAPRTRHQSLACIRSAKIRPQPDRQQAHTKAAAT